MTRIVLIASFIAIFSVGFTGHDTQSTNISQTDVVNPEWCVTDNGPMVWGTNATRSTLVVYCYDKDLNIHRSFKKSFSGMTADVVHLFHKDSGIIEFMVQDHKRKKQAFVQLNMDMKELYYSGVFNFRKIISRDSTGLKLDLIKSDNVIADFRSGNFYWELIKTRKIGSDNQPAHLLLQQMQGNGNDTLPDYNFEWRYNLQEESAEFIKFIGSYDDCIFLYANFSTLAGEQYIYCVKKSDGSLKYRTKLALKNTQACLYSNHVYDSTSRGIIIGGTCLFPVSNGSMGYPGMFVVRLDRQGSIISSDIKNEVVFSYPPTGQLNGTTTGLPSRNQKTYYKFRELNILPGGELVTFIDCYSMITLHKGTANSQYLVDTKHHYLMTQCFQYRLNGNALAPVSGSSSLPSMQYQAGVNFAGINNYEIQKTHLHDSGYVDNVNEITLAGKESGYFVGFVYDKSSQQAKCLLRNSFVTIAGRTDLYFAATNGRKNFAAFQKPSPVTGQDVLIKSKFLIRDYATLYRITMLSNGFELSIQSW